MQARYSISDYFGAVTYFWPCFLQIPSLLFLGTLELPVKVHFLLIYICNFHVLNHLLLIFICKLHWIKLKINMAVSLVPCLESPLLLTMVVIGDDGAVVVIEIEGSRG